MKKKKKRKRSPRSAQIFRFWIIVIASLSVATLLLAAIVFFVVNSNNTDLSHSEKTATSQSKTNSAAETVYFQTVSAIETLAADYQAQTASAEAAPPFTVTITPTPAN